MKLGNSANSGLKAKSLLAVLVLVFSLSSFWFVFPAQAEAATATLTVKASIRMGDPIVVSGTGFSPDEKLAFWLTSPTNAVIPAGYVNVSHADGSFSNFTLKGNDAEAFARTTAPYGTGQWALTAQGLSSGIQVFVNFTVLDTTLLVSALNIGNSIVVAVYAGANWFPQEKVFLWVTDSVGNVIGLGYGFADRQGKIPDPTSFGFIFGGTAGYYYLTAQGEISKQPRVIQFVAPLLGS